MIGLPNITLTADRTVINEGESVNFTTEVLGPPRTCVKVCVYIFDIRLRSGCNFVDLDHEGHGKKSFSITFPVYGTYPIKVCIVNPATNEPINCSEEIIINVKRVGTPKLIITAEVDKTTVYEGESVTIRGSVKNIGTGTSGNVTVRIYMNGAEIFDFHIPYLSPGHEIEYDRTIRFRSGGVYKLQACVTWDSNKSCSEQITVTVRKPPSPPPPEPLPIPDNTPIELVALGIGLLAVFGAIAYMEFERQRTLELTLLRRKA